MNEAKETEVALSTSSTSGSGQVEECMEFDQVLDLVGSEGKYQKFLVYAFLTPLIIIAPLLELNLIFLFDVPDHWCHVPGGNATDLSLAEWKDYTLPRETGPDGNLRHSPCHMYDIEELRLYGVTNKTTVCMHGWDFNKTDYESTIPSAFHWVCDRSEYAADVISLGTVGAAVGTFFYGMLADKIGRKPVFFMVLCSILVFRGIALMLPENIRAFQVVWFLAGSGFASLYTIPGLAIAEVSSPTYRSWVYAIVWIVWVVGNCLLPIIAWASREWLMLGLLTTLPGTIMLFYYPYVLESPRWLLTKGKKTETVMVLKSIAVSNGVIVEKGQIENLVEALMDKQKDERKRNRSLGLWSLFQKANLAKNTILLCIAWGMNGLLYFGITLNTTSLEGNKFLNYFLMSLIELPSGYLAGILVERTGRRWTQVGFFGMSFFSCLLSGAAVGHPSLGWLETVGALGIKFGVSVSFLVAYLQGTEIFPTPLRSTGSAFAATISAVVGATGPYIVYTGTTDASLPYIILAGVTIIGLVAAAFLPETLHQSLPETLQDADNFGKYTKFWSYLPEDAGRKGKKVDTNGK